VSEPFASASVEAVLDFSKVDREFATRVEAATRKAAAVAEKNIDRIVPAAEKSARRASKKLGESFDGVVSQAEKTAKQVEQVFSDHRPEVDPKVNPPAKADLDRFQKELVARVKKAAEAAEARVPLTADGERLRQQIRREAARATSEVSATIPLDAELGARQRNKIATEVDLLERSLSLDVPVDLDDDGYRAKLAAMTRPVDQEVNIKTDRKGGAGLGGLMSGLGGVSGSAAKMGGVAAAIGAIGGAAGIAAGAVGALGVGLSAVGAAGVVGLGTTVLALQGVGDAFSALGDAATSAGPDAAAQAKAVAAAQRGLEQSNRGLEEANRGVLQSEKDVRSAKKDSLDAERDLTSARKDATRQIEDLNFALSGTALDEKEAAFAVREAYSDLADARKTGNPEDVEKASLRVERALRSEQETHRRTAELTEKAAEANAKGAEGSDQVVAAKDRLVAANDAVVDSEQGLADAHYRVTEAQRDVADAQTALQDAMTGTSAGADKAAQALAKLSPNAREFVLAMMAAKPVFDGFKNAIQDAVFADLGGVFSNLANTALPALQDGLVGVGGAINGAAKDFAAFFSTPEALGALNTIFAGTADLITAMQPGLAALTGGMLDLGAAAAPVMGQIGDSLGNLVGTIGAVFSEAFADGSLTELFGNFSTILDGLAGGFGPLLTALIDLGNMIGPVLGPLLTTLGESLAALGPSLGQLGVAFGEGLQLVLPVLSQFISALADGLTPIMPILAELLTSLGQALMPLIPPLSQIIQALGTALVGAVQALAPAVLPLGQALASLVTALAPILPLVAELVGTLIANLAPALTTVFTAIAPVIQQLVTQLKPVFEQLAPILAQVAGEVGVALAGAVTQLAPLLPMLVDGFTRIVGAIAPLLPQLVQIWADYLPQMISLLVYLAENVLPPVMTAFEWLAKNVLPIVIDAIGIFASTFGDSMARVQGTLEGAKNFISGAVEDIKGFFSGLGSVIGSVWEGVVDGIKIAVRAIGNLLKKVPASIEVGFGPLKKKFEFPGVQELGNNMLSWANGGRETRAGTFARGGPVVGKGGPTDDAIAAYLSNGEFVVNAAATKENLELLRLINSGVNMEALVSPRRFAVGGLVSADELDQFAQGVEGQPYVWGGVNWGDCSGAVSALANYAVGMDPFGSRFATGSEESELASRGFLPGLGPAGSLNIGWFNGGPYGGHTAATLPSGVNFEMGGQRGDGQYGGIAAAADDPMFTDHAHLPPEAFLGGDPTDLSGMTGGASGGGASINFGNGGGGGGASGGGGGGGGFSGGGGGGGGGFSGGGFSGGNGGGGGVVQVFVTNWPGAVSAGAQSQMNGAVGGGLPATVGAGTSGYNPGQPSAGASPQAYGIDAANQWASQQDFGGQARDWGLDAVKEIGGQFLDPLGLSGAFNSAVDSIADSAAKMLEAQRAQQPQQGDGKLADTIIYQGMDPQKAAEENRRMLNERMAPVTSRYRSGG
jgi:phage-related protein